MLRLFVPLLGFILGIQPAAAQSVSVASEAASVEQGMRTDIEYLASDELRGRSATDDSIDIAAEYVIGRMSEIGLQTDLFDGSAKQSFQIPLGPRAGKAEDNRVEFTIDEAADPIVAKLGAAMNPMAIGVREAELSAPVVFAGYGITAADLNYDDYADVDATGSAVIVLRKEPGMNDPNSRFNGTRNTRHAFFATKVANAIDHGAAAMILVNDPASVQADVQNVRSKIAMEQQRKGTVEQRIDVLPEEAVNGRKQLRSQIAGIDSMIDSLEAELVQAERGLLGVGTAGDRKDDKTTIPVVSVTRDVIDQVLRESIGKSLEELEAQIDETGQPQSASLANTRVDLEVSLKPTYATSSNVIGVLPGKGELAEETVVVGAHYDHVGMGDFGSLAPGTVAVHNGADDNASGTAAMLAVADILAARLGDEPAHRRVLFIAFTGEERGLLGSRHYVRNPRFPLDSTVAMINMDMVGRLRDNELTVYGTGSAESFDELVEDVNSRQQFKLFKVASGYGPSDHHSFYEAGIPVLFFFTGLHNDYHRPSDDSDKIDFGGMLRITDTVSEVTFRLATGEDRPKYAETERGVRIRRQMTAFLGVTLSQRGDQVVLSGITPGGPAERAGLRVGDRLEFLRKPQENRTSDPFGGQLEAPGEQRLRSTSDVLEALRQRSPGDQVIIQLIRDGKRIEATARLQARP